MVFNKQICMLIYVNLNNGGKMNCLKKNLNIKNVNINIKQLRKTSRTLTENPYARNPGEKNPHSNRHLLLTQTSNLNKSNISNKSNMFYIACMGSCLASIS